MKHKGREVANAEMAKTQMGTHDHYVISASPGYYLLSVFVFHETIIRSTTSFFCPNNGRICQPLPELKIQCSKLCTPLVARTYTEESFAGAWKMGPPDSNLRGQHDGNTMPTTSMPLIDRLVHPATLI